MGLCPDSSWIIHCLERIPSPRRSDPLSLETGRGGRMSLYGRNRRPSPEAISERSGLSPLRNSKVPSGESILLA